MRRNLVRILLDKSGLPVYKDMEKTYSRYTVKYPNKGKTVGVLHFLSNKIENNRNGTSK